MRDLANKMAELKFEAPLAQCEETDEWGPVEYQTSNSNITKKSAINNAVNLNNIQDSMMTKAEINDSEVNEVNYNTLKSAVKSSNGNNITLTNVDVNNKINIMKDNVDNFAEGFTGSLEDLVNTFDEKITKCFGNYEQSVEELAPVQVRSQDEIMSECQMWWTITGNFGNILPIDWSKTYARQMHVPTLKLASSSDRTNYNDIQDLSSEDEAVANDLDMHALILGGLHTDNDPIKTAEEVIKEIDDIMDESASEDGIVGNEMMEKAKEVLGSPLYEEKLRSLSITQLNELYMEMEVLIREFSETLISELALRDELEYEKELKNTFISLLLAVQNRRRQFHVERKKGKSQNKPVAVTSNGTEPKYLTTVIPYNLETAPDNQTLQILIKILKAINEDSPTVPTLLTDYILKVLCPT
ncbi:fasciculation and elongation protein zeta-2 [Aedes albopictus]|uniref:Putative kinesin-associated fasciculation and elongation protein involved in axonal transport n=1 Tax=Aedes albopictus TaxID=7160 RepID=A0A023ETZ5_AEDAL|nr:fasciculation and elongation protein zeta-2-like [Aedes albopictus]XP_029719291.1 fasciculation and elongation protein zeta-2-like [Aedes albopictus]XP_029719292.1 fasciculation and elongation protein zeta-2 [Aedes albopictus]